MSEPRVEVLGDASPEVVAALARLLPQVSSRAPVLTADRMAAVLDTDSTAVVVVRVDDQIAGMALLLRCVTLAGQFGLVEEVAVDEGYRGRHLSVHLMVGLLRTAKDLGLDFVELT